MSESSSVALKVRLRRLRHHPKLRDLLTETRLCVSDFVQPLFICAGKGVNRPIADLPGQFQLSVDQLESTVHHIKSIGLPAILLFGVPNSDEKDASGSVALQPDGLIQQAIRRIKLLVPDLLVIADLCLCEYTDHGHCGVLSASLKSGHYPDVDNDATLNLLAQQAVSLARAGADVIAPSGMMDGVVASIRTALDKAHFNHLPILSYAVKYASAFYAPFRSAAQGAPKQGDRCSYQMNPATGIGEALHEVALDVQEGADMLMVKPGHTYLDVILRIKQRYPELPLAAYHVSGEYVLLKAAVEKGWLQEERQSVLEVMVALKRAGADFIITYYAREIASWL